MDFLLLIFGLIGLWAGSELVIKGALDIGRHYRLSELFIGLTILAIGTDLPELFVSITAAIEKLNGLDTSGLVIGQTLGSAFSQIGLVLGIAGLLGVILIKRKDVYRDTLAMLISVGLLFLLSFDGLLSRTDGVIMILAYGIYLITVLRRERVQSVFKKASRVHPVWATSSLIGGFFILMYAASLTLDSALAISDTFGLTQSIIGILIIGLGTSLPELVTTITAARNRANALAIGNLLGSSTLDVLLPLGIGASISQFSVSPDILLFDIPALFILSIIVVYVLSRGEHMRRKHAIMLILVYVVYFMTIAGAGLINLL